MSKKQKNSQFENLKLLNKIISSDDISKIRMNISRSKKTLESFCINIKNRAIEINKEHQSKIRESQQEVEVMTIDKPKQSSSKTTDKTAHSKRPQTKGSRPARPDASKYSDRRSQPSSDFKKKPYSTSNKPFKSTGLLPKADKIETIIAKPERSFTNKPKTRSYESDRRELSKKSKMKKGYIADNRNYYDEISDRVIGRVRKVRRPKKQQQVQEKINIEKATITTENLTVKILAQKIGKPAAEIMKKFMMLGLMPTINSVIDFPTAELVANELGVELKLKLAENYEQQLEKMFDVQGDSSYVRPPVVTVMGHVDHGKTSLLDAIRKTNVSTGEAGGITQHIGGYSIRVKDAKLTFIDTPGHKAFTSMRARGAKITDLAILVVAADDGIMPQTVEAINHMKSENLPIIVAINKMDKPEANPERIKQQLTEHNLLPEEWGGDTICVPISAKTGMGLDKLLEMVLLVAEMSDLKADLDVPASGFILESKIDKGRGIVANSIIKNGTLKVGDFVISGVASGRVRAMMDHEGKSIKKANPSMAVSILGFNKVPDAGDLVHVVDERMAKNIIEERLAKIQVEKAMVNTGISIEDFLQQSAETEMKVLNIMIKADVKGTSEALQQTLEEIRNDEVQVKCISAGVGGVNESDVQLAQASNAIIIAFNVKTEAKAKTIADRSNVEIKDYKIIYNAVDDITQIITGMITPKYKEVQTGKVEIRQIFKISSLGNIAGCYVLEGHVSNKSTVKLMRDGEEIISTQIEKLQQQKDEVKQVKAGYECGIKLKGFNAIQVGDILEVSEMVQI